MKIEVSSAVVTAMVKEAHDAHPLECCGILLGDGSRITAMRPAANIHATPENHFTIDPRALVVAHRDARTGGPQVQGYYHSHPNGLERPSATDASMMTGQRLVWAIIAAGRVSFWREGDAAFTPLPYEVAPR